ncbi:hypothetical protein LQ327_25845 [Actinomycetospora endophytica]|uniref:Uncharacterized protein n=1 Tax=Actinomycetospora endophytica TaxID=2291215 RepID=A0ABS8PEW1_9PSEU|nr:hypothetical protein [Actinomycetospora endophytica]MCD2196799.1 hypothetical protein [Actinomycetospora endophytica]
MTAADQHLDAPHIRSVWEAILAAAARECPATTTFTTAQLLLWRTFAGPDEAIESEIGCSFERAHDGPHHAPLGPNDAAGELGQRDVWWLRWSDDGEHHEFVDAPFCPGTRGGAGHDFCVKPARHRAHHLWSTDLRGR